MKQSSVVIVLVVVIFKGEHGRYSTLQAAGHAMTRGSMQMDADKLFPRLGAQNFVHAGQHNSGHDSSCKFSQPARTSGTTKPSMSTLAAGRDAMEEGCSDAGANFAPSEVAREIFPMLSVLFLQDSGSPL